MQKLLEKLNFEHSGMTLGFVYYVEHLDVNGNIKSKERVENIIPDVGRDYILNTALNGGSPSPVWYASLYTQDYTPIPADTLVTLHASGVEEETYTVVGGARPTITPDALSGGLWSNAGTPIDFVFAAGAATLYGGFITNTQQRGVTTGTLLSAVKFAAAKVMEIGETLRVTCGLQLTSLAD